MTVDSQSRGPAPRRAYWIAAGFLGAFAASVFTVIYTGLMVEGPSAEFDAGFRSMSMEPGTTATLRFFFDVPREASAAQLEISLPPMLQVETEPGFASDGSELRLEPGENDVLIRVRALAVGQGYVIGRVNANEPLALDRVFVTVAEAGDEVP